MIKINSTVFTFDGDVTELDRMWIPVDGRVFGSVSESTHFTNSQVIVKSLGMKVAKEVDGQVAMFVLALRYYLEAGRVPRGANVLQDVEVGTAAQEQTNI